MKNEEHKSKREGAVSSGQENPEAVGDQGIRVKKKGQLAVASGEGKDPKTWGSLGLMYARVVLVRHSSSGSPTWR